MVYLGLWLLQNISTLKCQKHYLWEDLRNRQEYATKCLGHIFSLCNIASRFSKLSKQKRLIFGKIFLNKHEHTPLFMDFVATDVGGIGYIACSLFSQKTTPSISYNCMLICMKINLSMLENLLHVVYGACIEENCPKFYYMHQWHCHWTPTLRNGDVWELKIAPIALIGLLTLPILMA